MIIKSIFIILITMSTGSDLEISGDLVAAGAAYEQDRDIEGQIRILGRFLEEALYAGNAEHALNLFMMLEMFPVERSCYDFWYARLCWTCGLAQLACETLDSLQAGPWLTARSRGLAAQFRGDATLASEHFRESWNLASTSRERFYSALDLSFALMQTGDTEEARIISSYLSDHFPGEGLPRISFALCLQAENRFGEAMTALQSVVSGDYDPSAQMMAADILEDLE